MPPFFSNLLPEGHLRDYLAERAGVNPKREFFLLWVLGRDLPGALTIEAADGEAWPPGADGDAAADAEGQVDIAGDGRGGAGRERVGSRSRHRRCDEAEQRNK